jgi:hypothetical protein
MAGLGISEGLDKTSVLASFNSGVRVRGLECSTNPEVAIKSSKSLPSGE